MSSAHRLDSDIESGKESGREKFLMSEDSGVVKQTFTEQLSEVMSKSCNIGPWVSKRNNHRGDMCTESRLVSH